VGETKDELSTLVGDGVANGGVDDGGVANNGVDDGGVVANDGAVGEEAKASRCFTAIFIKKSKSGEVTLLVPGGRIGAALAHRAKTRTKAGERRIFPNNSRNNQKERQIENFQG